MSDRAPLHGSPEGLRRPPGPDPMAPIGGHRTLPHLPPGTPEYRPTDPTHVWVTTETGRHPGLLIEWRKPNQLPWHGRIVHSRLLDGRWVKVDEWVLAGSIEPAYSTGTTGATVRPGR